MNNNILMQDAARHPKLFVWNGTIESNQLKVWLQKNHQLELPQDLIELWEQTNGGELFETETILSPFGDDSLGDDIESVNEFYYSQRQMPKDYLLFHVGTGLSAVRVRLTDRCYVKLDNNYQEIAHFQSLDDWYRDELRSEYGKRYNIELEALKNRRQFLLDGKERLHKKGSNFLNRKEKQKFKNLEDRFDQEIGHFEVTMSSADITKSSYEPNFSEIKKALKNLDIPELKEAQQFLEDINERFYALEANTISEVEKSISDSGWLLPTSTFSKPVLDLLVDFPKIKDIDSFFKETLMISDRINETLSNWNWKKESKEESKEESFVNKRYPILEQAVKAHLNKDFYLSVSTLIPQIEGLLRDVLDEPEDFNSLYKEHMNRATRNLINGWKEKMSKLLNGQVAMLERLPHLVDNLYAEYKPKTNPRAIIPGKIYRNGICHGLQLDFGSEKNSLQLILLLDRIIYFTGLEES